MIGAGADITIQRSDTNSDRTIDGADFDQQTQNITASDKIIFEGTTYTYEQWNRLKETLKNVFITAATNQPPSEAVLGQTHTALAATYAEFLSAKETLEHLKSQTPPNSTQVGEAQQKLNQLKEILQAQVRQLEFLNRAAGKTAGEGIGHEIYTMAGISPEGGEGGRATLAMTQGAAPATPQQAGKAITIGGPPAGGFMPPAGWGAQTAFPQFNTDAYAQSLMAEDSILSSFDAVLKNQNKGKQMMMLFFYYAKMAESGDLGAMYQFMKFLTYIISKDKSKQQIDMGKKLIELQDLSRKWTDKLLGTKTDAADPNSSNEFMKTMTQVKSETDAIATSQKLIAQMMEEFAQIVETLTNTTKAALEANGRVLRTVSSVR